MELKYVKTKKCPICGCTEVVSESVNTFQHKISVHCNGTEWETREFACGYAVQYVPNFKAEQEVSQCYTIKEKTTNHYKNFVSDVEKYVDSLDYPDNFKNLIKKYIDDSIYRIK